MIYNQSITLDNIRFFDVKGDLSRFRPLTVNSDVNGLMGVVFGKLVLSLIKIPKAMFFRNKMLTSDGAPQVPGAFRNGSRRKAGLAGRGTGAGLGADKRE
ncbi:MAG: hypothetical protein LBR80_14510 [Deltaproteobacteria bacterium]|nr:hypothetical protein [Deltaproteobacteria bacterium]